MNSIKICTILGTRPEIIRLSRVIKKLDESFEHTLIHTGQNYDYELNQVFFNDLELRKPDYFLNSADKSNSPIKTISKMLAELDVLLDKISPDAVLILGDTNSALSSIVVKRKKIPLFHMEAGNRCFDERVPEEINRRLVDHISDINLTYSDIAREYLLMEGFPKERVIKTGSPMFEVLNFFKDKIDDSRIVEKLKLQNNNFYLVSCHREENIDNDQKFNEFISLLKFLSRSYDIPTLISAHPRTLAKIKNCKIKFNKKIKLCKPFGFFDYIQLQKSSKLVFSDSGTINEESSILDFPALNIRDAHERPEGMEEAAVMMVGFNLQIIENAMKVIDNQISKKDPISQIVNDYSKPNVSDKVIKIILSHIDYVNREIWKK